MAILLRLQIAGEWLGEQVAADVRILYLQDAALQGFGPHAPGVDGLLLVPGLGVTTQAEVHHTVGYRRRGGIAEARDLGEVARLRVPLGLHARHEDRVSPGQAHARVSPLRRRREVAEASVTVECDHVRQDAVVANPRMAADALIRGDE